VGEQALQDAHSGRGVPAVAFDGRSPSSHHAFGHGLNVVANLFGGTGLWMSMTTESWRQ
jgi:hypothetical protein